MHLNYESLTKARQQAPKRNFLRRTKATAPPETTETETSTDKLETTTNKFTRRGNNRFKSRKELEKVSTERNEIDVASRRPSLSTARRVERPVRKFVRGRVGGANATSSSPAVTSSSTISNAVTRRPFRVASRRRVPSPSTTAATTTITTSSTSTQPTTSVYDDEESLQDIGDTDFIEDPALGTRAPKNTYKVQRRPLVNLKDDVKDQNPQATNEEERKRQSKKYSASIKKNQLDDLIKVRSQEESTVEPRTTASEEFSSETAVAIAAHQLITAPLPSISDYDDDNVKPTRKTQTTVEYKYTSREYNEYTGSQTPSYEYQSTPRDSAAYDQTTAYKNDFDSTKVSSTDFDVPKASGTPTVPTVYKIIEYGQTSSDDTYSPEYETPKVSTSTYDGPRSTNFPNTANIVGQDYIRTTSNDYSVSSQYDSPKITPISYLPKTSTNYPTNTATNEYRTTLGNTYETRNDFETRVSSYLPKGTENSFANTVQEYRTTANTYPETSTEFVSKVSTSYVPRFSSTSFPSTVNPEFIRTTGSVFDGTPSDLNSPKISTTLSPPSRSGARFYPRTSTFANTLENSARTATSFIPKSTEATKYTRKGFSPRPTSISSPNIESSGYTGIQRGTQRYRTEKLIPVPVDEGYSTVGYSGSSQEPAYFTREYLLESPVTKTYDDEYQYLSPITTPSTPVTPTRKVIRKKIQRKISTTQRPTSTTTTTTSTTTPQPQSSTSLKPRRVPAKPFEKIAKEPKRKYRPIANYDYYDDSDEKFAEKYEEGTKVIMRENGNIQCLDIGNFPNPTSCKKFISCARIDNGSLLGWEYICPKGLSFDPVGGICNWSAGLGCNEKDV